MKTSQRISQIVLLELAAVRDAGQIPGSGDRNLERQNRRVQGLDAGTSALDPLYQGRARHRSLIISTNPFFANSQFVILLNLCETCQGIASPLHVQPGSPDDVA